MAVLKGALLCLLLLGSCGQEFEPLGGDRGDHCPNLETAVATLSSNPNNSQTKECVFQSLDALDPEEFCMLDSDMNGSPAAVDVLNLAKYRVALAPTEQPVKKRPRTKTFTQTLAEAVMQNCPTLHADATFVLLMFKVAQAAGPFIDFLSVFDNLFGADDADLTVLLGPISSILSPDLPCSDGGLAMCGRDVSDAVNALGDHIYERFTLPPTLIQSGDSTYDLGGTYNEPAFRLLAATGEAIHALMYFLAAHLELNSLLGGITPILNGGISCEGETAGQFLGALDVIDGMLLAILLSPQHPDSLNHLWLSRASVEKVVNWLTGGRASDAAILRSMPNQLDENLSIRLVDNGDLRLGACDSIQFNLAFTDALFSDYFDAQPATGCTEPVPPRSIQLPRTTSDGIQVDYDLLFTIVSALLEKFGRSVGDPSISLSFADASAILTATGNAPVPALAELYPGVLFLDGFSIFTPQYTGSEKIIRLSVEAETNQDAPECPDGKAAEDAWVCKGGGGREVCQGITDPQTGLSKRVCDITEDANYSASIFHGDADHFGKRIAVDNIFVTEELLDLYEASPTDFFRKARGGGYLLYIEPKYPDLRGFMKVDEGVLPAITDETKTPCDRYLAPWLTGKFVSPDARTLNALLNFAVFESKFCGNETIDTIGDTLFSCGGTSLEGLSCASSLNFNCGGDWACEDDDFSCDGGDFDLDCSPDLDFGCDSFDFDLGCPAPTQSSAQSAAIPMCMIADSRAGNLSAPSARAVRRLVRTALRPKPTPGSIAGMAVNFGLFLSPVLLIPLLRRAGRR